MFLYPTGGDNAGDYPVRVRDVLAAVPDSHSLLRVPQRQETAGMCRSH